MAQVTEANIPNAPNAPNVQYQTPTGPTQALQAIYDLGQRTADTSIAQSAEKQATLDQQASGAGNAVATDDTGFSTLYSRAYNKTANALFATQKSSALDAGLKNLYEQNINDPVAFNTAADKFKGEFLANVPALQQAPFTSVFTDKANAMANQVLTNQITLQHGQLKAAANQRIQELSSSIYQAVLAQGDSAKDNPYVHDRMAEFDVQLHNGTDPTQLGGAYISPQEALEARTRMLENTTEAGIRHGFVAAPTYQDKIKYVNDVVASGVNGVRPEKQQAIIGGLKADLNLAGYDYRFEREQAAREVEDTSKFLTNGFEPPPGLDALKEKVASLGDPVLTAKLNKAISIGAQLKGFTQQPVDAMQRDIDESRSRLEGIHVSSNATITIPESSALAFANNNPGNLKFAGQTGATEGDGGFAKFATPEAGIAALRSQVALDTSRGSNLGDFITKYAPPSENDTGTYISQATAALGVKADTPLSAIPADKLVAFLANKESGTKVPEGSSVQIADAYDIGALLVKEKLMFEAQKQLATDPLTYAVKHRLPGVEATALSAVNFGDPQSVTTRMDAVHKTEAAYGITVSPLTPQESKDLAKNWPDMAADQQVAHLDQFAQFNMSPPEQKALFQTLEKDNPSLPPLAAMLADTAQRGTAIDVIDGMNFVKNNKETVDKQGFVQRAIAGQLSSVIGTDPSGQSLKTMVPMVTGLYAKAAEKENKFEVNAADAEDNANKATAKFFGYKDIGDLPTINNKKFMPFEPGLSTNESNRVWASTTSDDLRAANGGALPTDTAGSQSHPIDGSTFANKTFPVYSGKPGQYYVGMTDKADNVFTLRGQNGQPFLWDYQTQKQTSASRPVPAPEAGAAL